MIETNEPLLTEKNYANNQLSSPVTILSPK